MHQESLFDSLTIDSVQLTSICGNTQTIFCLPWTSEKELREMYKKGVNLNKPNDAPFIIKHIQINYLTHE